MTLLDRFTPAVGVAVILLVHVAALAWMASGTLNGFGLDDAWIFQVVARNFAATGVLGFIPGQVSSGATSVLWPWLLAANFRWTHIDPVAYTLGLGMLCEVAAALAMWGVLRADGWSVEWATVAACSLAASGNWLWLAVNGMEAVLFVALGCAAIYAAQLGRDRLCAALLAALVLTRLEGIALAGILVLVCWWRERRLRLWPLVAAAAAFLCILLWSHVTRGTWLPTTMAGRRWLAGAGLEPPSIVLQLWVRRLIVLAGDVHVAELVARVALFGVAGAGLLWGCRRTTGLIALALWTAAQLAAYAIVLPSIGNGGRYQPMVLALIGPWTIAGVRVMQKPAVQTAVLTTVFVLGLSSLTAWRGVTQAATTHINNVHRRAATWIAAHVPEHESIAAYDIGALAWELPGRRVIDLGGLVDPAYLPFMRARAAWQYLDLHHVRWVVVPEAARDTPDRIVAPLALALGLFTNDHPPIERWAASTPVVEWRVGWDSVGHAYPQIGVYELPLSVRAFRDRHRIAHRITVEDERSVISDDAGLELRDGFIGAHLEYFGAAGDRITGPNRSLETPVHLKEYGARAREVFGHNRVEDCTRYTPLYDNLAEPARLRDGVIVMKWIPVSADLGEPFDICRVHRARALRDLPHAWDATRPDLIDAAAHKSQFGLGLPRQTSC